MDNNFSDTVRLIVIITFYNPELIFCDTTVYLHSLRMFWCWFNAHQMTTASERFGSRGVTDSSFTSVIPRMSI